MMSRHRRRRRARFNYRRRYRRNPGAATGGLALTRPKTWIPYLVTAAVSALTTGLSPRLLGPAVTPMYAYAVQGGVAVAGGIGLPMLGLRPAHGLIWFLVSAGVIVSDVLYRYLMPQLGLAAYPYEAHAALSSMGQEPYYPPRLALGAYPARYSPLSSMGDVGAYEPVPPMEAPWERGYGTFHQTHH